MLHGLFAEFHFHAQRVGLAPKKHDVQKWSCQHIDWTADFHEHMSGLVNTEPIALQADASEPITDSTKVSNQFHSTKASTGPRDIRRCRNLCGHELFELLLTIGSVLCNISCWPVLAGGF